MAPVPYDPVRLADICSEDIETVLPDSLFPAEAGDFFRCPVKRGNLLLVVNREDPISDAIQDDIKERNALICSHGWFTAL